MSTRVYGAERSPENMFTVTDPAINAAVATSVIDEYTGVLITLTAAGNAQTLQPPTEIATIVQFVVNNNDTSTHSITVEGIVLAPGDAQLFIWDGTAWGPTGSVYATTSSDGVVRLATSAEAVAGTEPLKAVTPSTLTSRLGNTSVTVGSGKTLDVSAGTLTLADNQISGDKVEGGTINAITINNMTGNLTLPDAGKITIDVSPDSDHTATGIIASYTAGENLVYGNLCYLKSDGKWWKSDADTAATMPGMKMALATISADASGLFLCWGVARDDSWAWTIGGMIYASTDGGGLTQTAPSGDGDQIQIVGKAKTATTIFFHPTEITAEVGLDYVDKGTADYTITMAELTAVPKTFAGNHSSDQTFTLAAPSAADAGKKFIQKKNGTGAGKLILQLPAGVTAYNAAGASSAAGTIYLAASARGTIQFTIESATSVSVDFADGSITTT